MNSLRASLPSGVSSLRAIDVISRGDRRRAGDDFARLEARAASLTGGEIASKVTRGAARLSDSRSPREPLVESYELTSEGSCEPKVRGVVGGKACLQSEREQFRGGNGHQVHICCKRGPQTGGNESRLSRIARRLLACSAAELVWQQAGSVQGRSRNQFPGFVGSRLGEGNGGGD